MTEPKPKLRRCAVYTRKSSEEGLEQDFNSLHAQREACEAYIKSQQHEGWRLVPAAYDDGGLSGGTMERPALQRLLADIGQGLVDIVAVYKVDRLTRSLMDFAKIVEQLDHAGASFVAVTQQFNTTTSMGRLTLNILLSFAQFEREIAGERIRDKIAASKRKGMWMGGTLPLGYDVRDRKLVINAAEAETVRLVYARYQELGSVRMVRDDLDRRGIRSKTKISGAGIRSGGCRLSRGALYTLLANPIYIGEIAHKGNRFAGQHAAIVDRAVWDAVQRHLQDHGVRKKGKLGAPLSAPLMGKLFDEAGARLTPSHTVKDGKRYGYYVSHALVTDAAKDAPQGWRLPARQIETLIATEAARILEDHTILAGALQEANVASDRWSAVFEKAAALRRRILSETGRGEALTELIDQAELRKESLHLTISLRDLVGGDRNAADALCIDRDVPMTIKRRGVEMRLVIESPGRVTAKVDPMLLKKVAMAHRCFEALLTGDAANLAELATREDVSDRYISSLLPLAFLAPDIVEAIAEGRQPPEMTAQKLIRRIELPIDWLSQKRVLGIR